MQYLTLKKYMYTIIPILLLLIYIGSLIGMIAIHYHELIAIPDINIYDVAKQYNWLYWLESSNVQQTIFSNLLQYLDINHFHSRGIIPIVVNLGFIFLLAFLITKIIYCLFNTKKHTLITQNILIFFTLIFLFSAIQDSSIVWLFNQQLFAAFFFPLLSYYLLVRSSLTISHNYSYLFLFSNIMILLTSPYHFSAFIILIFIGYILKIKIKVFISIFIFACLSFIIQFDNIIHNINIVHKLGMGNVILYILNYLGALFSYLSFEPCIATSSVLGGIFIIVTFVYFTYLLLSKKSTETIYFSILAYLFFYILTAFRSLDKIGHEDIIIFQNQYMTPSLISWSLIIILYVHHFANKLILQRRILTLSSTLIIVLFFYQIITYNNYEKKISDFKFAIVSLKSNIYDKNTLRCLLNQTYTMTYCPSKDIKKKMSMFTYWDIRMQTIQDKSNLIYKHNLFALSTSFNKNKVQQKHNLGKSLFGHMDTISHINAENKLISLHGWVYNVKETTVPRWLSVVDDSGTIVGYIVTGSVRKDIAHIYGKDALYSGFSGYIKYTKAPKKLFLTDTLGNKILELM